MADLRIQDLPVGSALNVLSLFEVERYISPGVYISEQYNASQVFDLFFGSGTDDTLAMFSAGTIVDSAVSQEAGYVKFASGYKLTHNPAKAYIDFTPLGNQIIANTKADNTGAGFAFSDTDATFGAPNGYILFNATTSRIGHGAEFKIWSPVYELSTDFGALNESALTMDSTSAILFTSSSTVAQGPTQLSIYHLSTVIIDTYNNGDLQLGANNAQNILVGNIANNTAITIYGQIQNYAALQMTSLTASTVPYLDSNQTFVSSAITPTELNYLSGTTSNIQNQINNINSGLSWKPAARVATNTNTTIAAPGASIDGIAMSSGDRVLLKNQTTVPQNGVYIWNGAAVPMTRATDCSTGGSGSTGVLGMTISVEEGTFADQIWICTTDAPITIGLTALNYAKSSATTYTGSNGVTLTGNNFTLDNSYFTGDVTFSGGAATIGANKVLYTMIASMTSSNFAGIISDETGSGALVFGTAPTISAPVITGHATIEGVTPTGATGTGALVFGTAPTFTNPVVGTQAANNNTTIAASTAYADATQNNSTYRILFQGGMQHAAGIVANAYLAVMNPSQPSVTSGGTGQLAMPALFYLDPADFPTVNGVTTKLRVRANLYVNATAPTGNYTFGLYPVTAGGGGAALRIHTIGTVVTGSTIAQNTPSASTNYGIASADFAIPAAGWYAIGVVTTATVATNSLVQMSVQLEMRNT